MTGSRDWRPTSPTAGAGALAVSSVALGLVTWPIAFDLGAYGVVQYPNVFAVFVASSILLVVTFLVPPYPAPLLWRVRAALGSPPLWLVLAVVLEGSTAQATDRPLFVVWLIVIGLTSVPLTLKLLVDMFTPGVSDIRSRRLTAWMVTLVIAVGVAGFLVGANNPRFMTCGDFAIAGSAEPDNCVD